MTKRWIGVDVHQSYCVAQVKNDQGECLLQERIPSTRPALRAFFVRQGPESEVAFEAGGSWPWFYDTVRPLVAGVTMGHPLKTRMIADAAIKNDRIDAGVLSDLLRGRLLPQAWPAPPEVREARQLTRSRITLVRLRAGMKTRIRSLLRLHGLQGPKGLFGPQGLKFLAAIALAPNARRALEAFLGVIRGFDTQIQGYDEAIGPHVETDPACQLLVTIPGVGVLTAAVLTAEIGDIRRFSSSRKLCAWAGLVPRLYSSGGFTRHGPLTKQGNPWVRGILCECVTTAVRCCPRFRSLSRRVQARSGKPSARAAVAREILTVAYAMLRSGEAFDAQRGMRTDPRIVSPAAR